MLGQESGAPAARLKMSGFVYGTLWILGAAVALESVRSFVSTLLNGPTESPGSPLGDFAIQVYVVLFLAGCANLIHQLFLYVNLHGMEHAPVEWRRKFPTWFESTGELALRIVAFLALLVVAGKLGTLLKVLRVNVSSDWTDGHTYAVGSLALFASLVAWDFGALYKEGAKGTARYLIPDAIGLTYWIVLAYALFTKSIAGWGVLVVIGLFVSYIVALYKHPDFAGSWRLVVRLVGRLLWKLWSGCLWIYSGARGRTLRVRDAVLPRINPPQPDERVSSASDKPSDDGRQGPV